jgi:hypothetical protein
MRNALLLLVQSLVSDPREVDVFLIFQGLLDQAEAHPGNRLISLRGQALEGLIHLATDADVDTLLRSRHWRLLDAECNTGVSLAPIAKPLSFAFKWEGLDLTVRKRLFLDIGVDAIGGAVRSQPTGSRARRTWFLTSG